MILPAIICFSNFGYKDFAENFIKNVIDKIHNHNVVYYCLDDELYDYLSSKYNASNIKFEKYINKSGYTKEFADYNSSNFMKITET